MRNFLAAIFVIASLFLYAPRLGAWTDAVEGMLMPSPRGDDEMSDPEAVEENVDEGTGEDSGDTNSLIEWQ